MSCILVSSAHAKGDRFNRKAAADQLEVILARVENNEAPSVQPTWHPSAQVSILNSIEQHYWSRKDFDNRTYQKTLLRLMRLPPFWRNLSSSRLMKLKALDALDLAHVEQVKSPVFLLLSIVPSSNWFGTLVAKVEQVPQIAAGLRLANLMQRSPRSLITRLSNELVEYRTKHALAMREPKAALSILVPRFQAACPAGGGT